ncbi:MAG: alpha-mannosidase [Bacilli bacterium]
MVSHSHWDREWYLPYERHHMLLIELMDKLLEQFAKDPQFKHYHLDGQTIILDDYLQVRPEKREEIAQYIKEGRLHIGPWYVLQDEFLTSSEANVRNLLIGHQDAAVYGENISKLGYFPDSFGNMGQAPQMLKEADIHTAVFGRGVKPTGFNNVVTDCDRFESPYSEMLWQSPDGTDVLGILFANWYSNGNEIPTDEAEAKIFWDKKLSDAEKYASTQHLLFMNGCDHQPLQTDVGESIATAQKLYPDVEFSHSNFDDYIAALQKDLPENLTTVHGELRSQQTEGWYTLVNTASARVYLKQWNERCQTMLEKVAEPLATMAHHYGMDYPHHQFTYAWKTLMQNHPHDSICGCSVDDVHREMVTRFEKAYNVARHIIDESKQYIEQKMKTTDEEGIPFVLFNPAADTKTQTVSVTVEIERRYFTEAYPNILAEALREKPFPTYKVVNKNGDEVAATIVDGGVHFGYDLPKDRFRQPYMAKRAEIEVHVENIEGFSWETLRLIETNEKRISETFIAKNETHLENEHVALQIGEDGAVSLFDKATGVTYTDLCVYENTGDIGNEYVYKQPKGEVAITTKGLKADITLQQNSDYKAVVKIVHKWELPKSAEESLDREINDMIEFRQRNAQRVEDTNTFVIETYLSLEKGQRMVQVRSTMQNNCSDHRVRALFPTDIETEVHNVDAIFEVAERPLHPSAEWTNPSNCQHQAAFVNVRTENAGLTIANQGLQEYEVLRDGRNTIAITLLRAVRELGDWGVFHTPEAQCQGTHTVEYAMIPHGEDVWTSYKNAYAWRIPLETIQASLHDGSIPSSATWMTWSAKTSAHSTLKVCKETGDCIARWFNMEKEEDTLTIDAPFAQMYRSTILEKESDQVVEKAYTARRAEIVTIGMKTKK